MDQVFSCYLVLIIDNTAKIQIEQRYGEEKAGNADYKDIKGQVLIRAQVNQSSQGLPYPEKKEISGNNVIVPVSIFQKKLSQR